MSCDSADDVARKDLAKKMRELLSATTYSTERYTPKELEELSDILHGRTHSLQHLFETSGRMVAEPLFRSGRASWSVLNTEPESGFKVHRRKKDDGPKCDDLIAMSGKQFVRPPSLPIEISQEEMGSSSSDEVISPTGSHNTNFAGTATSSSSAANGLLTHKESSFPEKTDTCLSNKTMSLPEIDFKDRPAPENSKQTNPEDLLVTQKAKLDKWMSKQREGVGLVDFLTMEAAPHAHRELTTWNDEYLTTLEDSTGRDMRETFRHLKVEDEDCMPPNPEDLSGQPTKPSKVTDTNVPARDSIPSNRAEMILKSQQAANTVVGGSLTSLQKRVAVKKAKNRKRPAASPRPAHPLPQRREVPKLLEENQATGDDAMSRSGHDVTIRSRTAVSIANLLLKLQKMNAAWKAQLEEGNVNGPRLEEIEDTTEDDKGKENLRLAPPIAEGSSRKSKKKGKKLAKKARN